jgi:hypothetical protein
MMSRTHSFLVAILFLLLLLCSTLAQRLDAGQHSALMDVYNGLGVFSRLGRVKKHSFFVRRLQQCDLPSIQFVVALCCTRDL